MTIYVIQISELDGDGNSAYSLHNEYFIDRKHGPQTISGLEEALQTAEALGTYASTTFNRDPDNYSETCVDRFSPSIVQVFERSSNTVLISYSVIALENSVDARSVDSIVG